jgi:protein gp37
MAEGTAISWAHDTFNPWEGCTRISPACDNCYAAERAHRFGNDHLWAGELRRTSPANWRKPLKWNEEAKASGQPRRVFCASLADVFDNQAPQEWRDDLWNLIEATPHLTWMLLTKRPQNIVQMAPVRWRPLVGDGFAQRCGPRNVWIGTTAEDQERADQRLAHLAAAADAFGWLPFVSDEPLLGPVDLTKVRIPATHPGRFNALTGDVAEAALFSRGGQTFMGRMSYPALGLVIAGGESGRNARPSHPDWFHALRDQCAAAGVAFHFKQWGEWVGGTYDGESLPKDSVTFHDRGTVPAHDWGAGKFSARVGNAVSGRKLNDGAHDAMPGEIEERAA